MFLKIKLVAFILFAVLLNSNLKAQNSGIIKGTFFDESKNENIPNVSVIVLNTTNGTTGNTKGDFALTNLKAGQYSIVFSCMGYDSDTMKNIIVTNGVINLGILKLNQTYVTGTGTGKSAKRKTASMNDAIIDIKKSEVVANNISMEQIKNSQDNDAAKAAARVPGVTLIENRFIMLRGLSQRYNSVQINGINAPSTEVDKRAFSFDLIPSNMLDKIMILKSPSSDLAGDFAGGVIKIYTKSLIERDFLTVGFGVGYRFGTTFSNAENNSVGSNTDYLGFDNGNRNLPSNFPTTLGGLNAATSIAYGKQLNNNFELNRMRVPIDFGWNINNGINFKIGKMKVYNTNSLGYSTNYLNNSIKRYRFQLDETDYVKEMFNYTDNNLTIESKINVLSNWIFRLNKNNTLVFKNIFNQVGENETTIRTGVAPTERSQDEFKNYAFHYMSRGMYFGQLEGTSYLNNRKDKLTYGLGYSNIKRNEPDFRRFRTARNIGSGDAYTLIDPPGAALFDAARFYSKLVENTYSATINYEKTIPNFFDQSKEIAIRAGGYREIKSRNFDARWLSYTFMGDPTQKNDFLKQPINEIFAGNNLNSTAGFRPNEGTNPSDRYEASNELDAAYLNLNVPFQKFSINAGVRFESFRQTLNSQDQNGPIDVKLNNNNFLPSFNCVYYFNDKNLLRAAYGKTLNRPEFRELAPFVYYDFMYDVNIVGNPNLKSATINNFDLRYETYPSKTETISFGVFYKRFINPIENYVVPVGLSQQFELKNAKSATNLGAEIEIRKSLENISKNKFLNKISMNVNLSYIRSMVDLGKDSTLSQARNRPLQGQSPYIINAGIMYQDKKSGNTATISYNIFGERIAYVGNSIFPTVYEMPRHSLDITFIKEFSRRLSVKFGISDLLNFKYQLWQDTNNDGKINMKKDKTDNQLMQNRRGQAVNLGVSYKIY